MMIFILHFTQHSKVESVTSSHLLNIISLGFNLSVENKILPNLI